MNKMYVLVRKDIDLTYASVQAGHAVAEFCLKNSISRKWNNSTLIYLGVNDEECLFRWAHKLKSIGISFEIFEEPDIGNQKTALATVCEDKIFKKLKLL